MTIKKIKIYGERNSGTNYLEQLLKKNIKNVDILLSGYKSGSGWKHGFPNMKLFNNLDDVLFIFIIRDFKSWLKSMYKQPYHYIPQNTFEEFINNKLNIKDNRIDHDVNINSLEKQNIIDLRYLKINSYLDFFNKVNNAIFINLEDLQNNTVKFLDFLNKNYLINVNKKIIKITEHTKDKKLKVINRNWNIIVPDNIKNENKNIENQIENLKKKYYYKSKSLIFN